MRIASIGECMAEFTMNADDTFNLGFAGDTYNTAVYMKRLMHDDADVHFITATGDDWLSDRQLESMRAQGIRPDVARVLGASPALYIVKTDASGERTFTYFREASPVRHLLARAWNPSLTDRLYDFDLIYFSAITLQMMTEPALNRFWHLLSEARQGGSLVAFDSNYRAKGWASRDRAVAAIDRAKSVTDIALPSLTDEMHLDPNSTISSILNSYVTAGAAEVILKDGASAVRTFSDGDFATFAIDPVSNPVDTTGAGDSFNAGYLAKRLAGASVASSIEAAAKLARVVIMAQGAIMSSSLMTSQLPSEGQPRYPDPVA